MSDRREPRFPRWPLRKWAGAGTSAALLATTLFFWYSLARHAPLHLKLMQIPFLALAVFRVRWALYLLGPLLVFFGLSCGRAGTLGSLEMPMYFIDMVGWFIAARWLVDRVRKGRPPFLWQSWMFWLLLFFVMSLLSLAPIAREFRAHLAWVSHETPGTGPLVPSLGIFHVYKDMIPFYDLFAYQALLHLLLGLFMVCVGMEAFPKPRHRSRFLGLMTAGLGLSMLLGWLDVARVCSLEWYRPHTPSPVHFTKSLHRLQSLFGHSGWYAEYLSLFPCWILAFVFALQKPGRFQWKRVALLILFFCMGLVSLFTFQRGAWYAIVFSSLIVVALQFVRFFQRPETRRKAWAVLAMTAVISFVGAAVLLVLARNPETPIGFRLRSIAKYENRKHIWASAWELSRRYPVFGTGIGLYYRHHLAEFPPGHPFHWVDKGTAHNTYLHILAERGPIALVFFLAAISLILLRLLLAFLSGRYPPGEGRFLVGGLAFMGGWLLYGMVQYMFYIRAVDVAIFLLMGISLAGAEKTFRKSQREEASHEAAL